MNKMMIAALFGAIAMLLLGVGLITASVVDSSMDPEISEAEAKRIAEEETGGTAIDVELEKELGGPVYEVTVRTDDGLLEVEIDGDTGEVLEIEKDDGDDDDDDDDEEDDDGEDDVDDEDDDDENEDEVVSGVETTISEDEAKEIAEEETGGTAISVHLEKEYDGYVYEVLVNTDDGYVEVEIDAEDGTVLEVEKED